LTFDQIGLDPDLLRAIAEAGYETPTPIQERAVPHALAGRDLLGIAQTGTGKTAAFALPILQRLPAPGPGPRRVRVLVLAPTRELATQIGDSFAAYGKYKKLRHIVIFGGVGYQAQKDGLARGADILVATPGRLLDLLDQGVLSLDRVEVLVLDEADRMLDMGFIHDVKKVIAKVPKKRQTFFFSATMPDAVVSLSKTLLIDPVRVEVTPVASTAEKVQQKVLYVEKEHKRDLLTALVSRPAVTRAIVFTRTKHGANRVAEHLVKAGVGAAAIHGNKSQSARESALGGFRDGRLRVLVATDIAARGIDVDDVSHVINFDLPDVPEQYVHRIGRTARAGATGIALSFCELDDRSALRDIEKLIQRPIPVATSHPFISPHPPTYKPPPSPRPQSQGRNPGRRGGRGRGH
jgi:ATP-dependent RNA helicase RhlE